MNTSLKQRIYTELKQRIIVCKYRPGEFLTEEKLCEELGASRTPVRDAISRLEQEQLLTIHPKKGIKVNRVSLRSVNELFEARLRIEPYAVQQYGKGNDGNDKHNRVYYCTTKNLVGQQSIIVFKANKRIALESDFIEAQPKSVDDRPNHESKEQDKLRKNEQVACLLLVQFLKKMSCFHLQTMTSLE